MNEAERAQRNRLLEEFADLFERETILLGQVRRNHRGCRDEKRQELDQVSEKVENLREKIAGLSQDQGVTSD